MSFPGGSNPIQYHSRTGERTADLVEFLAETPILVVTRLFVFRLANKLRSHTSRSAAALENGDSVKAKIHLSVCLRTGRCDTAQTISGDASALPR